MRASMMIPAVLLAAPAAASSSSSTSLSVFSSHPQQLHLVSSHGESPPLSADAASAIVGSIVGQTPPSARSEVIPLALDLFNRPGASVLVAVEGDDLLAMEELGNKWHDLQTFEVESEDPQDIVELLVGDYGASYGGVSAEELEAFVKGLGVKDFGLDDYGEDLIDELKSIVAVVKKQKRAECGDVGASSVDVVKVSSLKKLKNAGDSKYESASNLLSTSVSFLLSSSSSSPCSSVIQYLRAETFGTSSRYLLDSTTTPRRLSPTASNSTNMSEIELYQICLWTSIVLVLVLYWVIYMVGSMDTNMDPMLLAKFKADVGDGVKYD